MVEVNEFDVLDIFREIVPISSISFQEKEMIDYLAEKFDLYGFKTYITNEDKLKHFNTGNLICRIDETVHDVTDEEPIFFCTHVDTVHHHKPIIVIENVDTLFSDGETILAADPKMAITCMLECMRLLFVNEAKVRPVEFVFTVGEELGSKGAKAMESEDILSRSGYVLDHEGIVGTIINKAHDRKTCSIRFHHKEGQPISTYFKRIIRRIKRLAQRNISSCQVRDFESSIVDGKHQLSCKVDLYDNSSKKLHKIEKILNELFDKINQSDLYLLHSEFTEIIAGYHVDKESPLVQDFVESCEKLGINTYYFATSHQTDANVLAELNKEVINLGVGYKNIHTTEEIAYKEDFVKLTEILIDLIKR